MRLISTALSRGIEHESFAKFCQRARATQSLRVAGFICPNPDACRALVGGDATVRALRLERADSCEQRRKIDTAGD
jgi:hypothetical protein